MEFKVGDYVRYNEATFAPYLVRNAVYRVARKHKNGSGLELEGVSEWFHGWRFIPWKPEVGDWVASDEFADVNCAHRIIELCFDDGLRCVCESDGVHQNTINAYAVPVLNRAPYKADEEKFQQNQNEFAVTVFDLRGKTTAEAIKEIAAKAQVQPYSAVFNPAGLPSTPHSPDGPVFTPSPEIKIPIGSTKTDELMRQRRELQRAQEREREESYESDKEILAMREHLLFCDGEEAHRADYLSLVKTKGPF